MYTLYIYYPPQKNFRDVALPKKKCRHVDN
nr:MAG TPA: hypothetical protein [Caudoviricetes sp.]